MGDPSELNIRTCRACQVDVSVPANADTALCPRCDRPLTIPDDPDGEATDRTLLELRSEAATVKGDDAPAKPPSGWRPRPSQRVLAPDEETEEDSAPALAQTATFRDLPKKIVRRLGPYELRGILGKGGMGVVYEAFQPALDRTVALKVISSEEASEEELQRFLREARAAAKLQHPNIVPIFEVGISEGRNYFTMDMVKGQTLTQLARSEDLAPERAARIISKVAKAIHYAHQRKIIHRDLKPSNILVDDRDEPHVMDFGLAKDLSEVSGLTLTGVAMGSPPYMPPEQARGDFRQVDTVSDVYGLGASLYECLTGRPPFKGKSLYDVIAKVLVEEPTPPRKQRPNVPYDLETICLKALEKEKWRRYPTAEDMARDLDRHLEGRTIHAARQGFTTRLGRVLERHKLQIFSVLIPISVVAALSAYVFGKGPDAQPQPPASAAVRHDAGAVAGAAEVLAGGERTAVATLLEICPTLPAWEDVERSLERRAPDTTAYDTFRRQLTRLESSPSQSMPTGKLARLIIKLIDDPRVDHRTLGNLVEEWISPGDPKLATMLRRATLALRGARDVGDPSAFQLALEAPLTPIDWAVLKCAAETRHRGLDSPDQRWKRAIDTLCEESDPQRQIQPLTLERYRKTGRIRALRFGKELWTFPPVSLPGETKAKLPRLHGLEPMHRAARGEGEVETLLHPTPALATAKGDRVVVGWLRQVYLLDGADGRILRRARLPGLAKALEYTASGKFRLEASEGKGVERLTLVLTPGDGLELTDDDGKPLTALELIPTRMDDAPDHLRRTAAALLPEFDDLIELREQNMKTGVRRVKRRIHYLLPPRHVLQLGFRQRPGIPTPCVTDVEERTDAADLVRVLLSVDPGSRAGPPPADHDPKDPTWGHLSPGDWLLDILPPEGKRSGMLRLQFRKEYKRQKIVFEGLRTYRPIRMAGVDEWLVCAERGERYLKGTDDPNPWLQAFTAVAAAWGDSKDLDGEALARAAARSRHLVPHERVQLGCFLDRGGYTDAADLAFQLTLERLTGECDYVPGWAGYGAIDCGRPIAERIEELWAENEGERALTLTRWRNAFAPVLIESSYAAKTYTREGARPADFVMPQDLATPPPALEMRSAPRKGIAGLQALSLRRIDHAIRLQPWFLLTIVGLLVFTWLRYRRHSKRALERLGAQGFAAQQVMWFKRPWVRLRYTWPMFFTLSDKLSFVVLYLAFFGVFAVQDAGLEAFTAQNVAPRPLVAGVLTHQESAEWLKQRYADDPDPEGAYAVAWVLAARGETPLPSTLNSLRQTNDHRSRLLLGEILLAQEEPAEDPEVHLAAAATSDALAPRVELLRARQAGDRELERRLIPAASQGSLRLQLAQQVSGRLPRLLAPEPTAEERDRLLTSATSWWTRTPVLLLRNLVSPWPEETKASLAGYEHTYEWNIDLTRMRSEWFFLVPASLVLLIASLFMPNVHPFEPLKSDLKPPPLVRILSLVFPGMPQFMRGKPVRAVLLLLPFVYIAQTLYLVAWRPDVPTPRGGFLGLGTNLSPFEMASMTAENVGALEAIRVQHFVEMTVVLLLLYMLHLADLALTQRKKFKAGPGPKSQVPLVIPVDSEAGIPELESVPQGAGHTLRDEPSHQPGREIGPFDATERELPSGTDLFDSTKLDSDMGSAPPLEATIKEPPPVGSDSQPFSDSNPGDEDFA